jgi:NitT/TauT family transport system ATP-binding protein
MKLDVKDLTVSYRMRRTGESLLAIRDLSFGVAARSFVTIVGPSGCGKSTLLKAIAGLIPPAAGEIWLDGRSLRRPGQDRAMVFQSPALLPWRTVLQNVRYGLELQGADRRLATQRALDHIRLVGLAGFEESYPTELSEGMRQRVNLARALATEPELLLLDEPFAALDSQTRLFMQLELQSIWARTQSMALFVTHQITEAILLGDQVVVLSGRPARVKEIIQVALPRPRSMDMKRSAEFNQLEERIWDLVGQEVMAMGGFAHLGQEALGRGDKDAGG